MGVWVVFDAFVNQKLKTREAKLMKKSHLLISVPEKFSRMVAESRMVSSTSSEIICFCIATKGRSNLLLNREKRFEKEAKQAADKAEKAAKDSLIKRLEEEVAALKDELMVAEQDKYEAEKNRSILSLLYDQNVIDKDGNPVHSSSNDF